MKVGLVLPLNPPLWTHTDVVAPVGKRLRTMLPREVPEFYDAFREAAAGMTLLRGPLHMSLSFRRRCAHSARGALSSVVRAIECSGEGVLFEDYRQLTQVVATCEAYGPKVVPRIELVLTQLREEAR